MKKTSKALSRLLALVMAFCVCLPTVVVSAEDTKVVAFLGNTKLVNELVTPYPEQMQDYLEERLGASVTTISGNPVDFDADDFMNHLVEDIMPQKPDIVFLELDISKRYKTSQADLTARLESMVRTMIEAEKVPAIYFIYYPEETMVDGREPFEKVAAHYGIQILDVFKHLKASYESGKLPTRAFLTAGIIPSEEGHSHLARLAKNMLDNVDNLLKIPKRDVKPLSGVRYETVTKEEQAKSELATDGTVLYVSKKGTPGAAGTIDAPLASVEEAQQRIRAIRKKQGDAFKGATVYIREGIYQFPNSLHFTLEDSGTDNAGVVYAAYEGETVRFTNGVHLDSKSFKPVTDAKVLKRFHPDGLGNILQYDLKAAGIPHGEFIIRTDGTKFYGGNVSGGGSYWAIGNILVVNGIGQDRARYPNGGWEIIADHQDTIGTHFAYSGNAPERWDTHSGQAYLRTISGAGYWHWFSRYTGADTENKFLNVLQKGSEPQVGWFWSIVNILEELDTPGEWCVEEETGILYYYPRDGFDTAEIMFSANTKPIVKMDGAKNITLKGIHIECGAGAAVEINDGIGNTVLDCTLANMGNRGVAINHSGEPGPGNNGVVGCHIYNTAASGVSIIGGDKKGLTMQNDYVENCHFENYTSYGKHGTAGVYVSDAVGTYIRHCNFHNDDGTAIQIAGTEQYIEYNEINNVVKESDDSGALYSQYNGYTDQGLHFQYNYMHDVVDNLPGKNNSGIMGFYCDASDNSGARAENNVFERVDQPIFFSTSKNQTAAENLLIDDTGMLGLIYNNTSTISGSEHVNTQAAIKQMVEEGVLEDYRGIPLTQQKIYGGSLYYYIIAYLTNTDFSGDNQKNYFLRYPWLERYIDHKNPYGTEDLLIRDNAFFDCQEKAIVEGTSIGDKCFTKYGNYFSEGELPGYTTKEEQLSRIDKAMSIAAERIEGFEVWDVRKAGLLGEARPVGDFELLSPKNNLREIDPTKVYFCWDYASGADEYRVQVANDPEFKDIVFDEVTTNNYITATNLKAGARQYYWKVTAKSQSAKFTGEVEAVNGPFTFRTMRFKEAEKLKLGKIILTVEGVMDGIIDGTEPGQYKPGTKAKLEEAYARAQQIYEAPRMEQRVVDEVTEALRTAYIEALCNANLCSVEAVDIYTKIDDLTYVVDGSNKMGEAANSKQFSIDGDSFTLTGRNTVYTKNKLPAYNVLSFRGTFDFGGSQEPWAVIGLNGLNYHYNTWSSSSYVILIRNHIIELQAFKPHVSGVGGIYKSVPNTYIKEGVAYDMEFCAIPHERGTRLVFRIEGEIIFDYIDETNPMFEGGYMQMHTLGDQVVMTIERSSENKGYPTLYELLIDPESELNKKTQ